MTECSYFAFLSHNWGNDLKGRNNHDRVILFKKALERHNNYKHKFWIDSDEMNGSIVEKMCDGIEKSEFVITFITDKILGECFLCTTTT